MSDTVYTSARSDSAELRPMTRRRTVREHLRELAAYRELLVNLTRKELTVRYQRSVLGFAWSMIQPVFLLGVYTLVFRILGAGFDNFAIWVLSGLLLWTFVNSSLLMATQSITENRSLVDKVKFPRAVLPLSSVTSALVHLGLQMLAFTLVLAITRHSVDWAYIWLVPLSILTAVLIVIALALTVASMNVYARDTAHLLDLVSMGWFWGTPILYPYYLVADMLSRNGIPEWVMFLNPLTPIVLPVQRAVYGSATSSNAEGPITLLPENGPLWYLGVLGITATVALLLCGIMLRMFDRAEVNIIEAL